MTAPSARARIGAAMTRLEARRRGGSPAAQRALFAVAAVVFVVLTGLAVRDLPPIDGGIRWWVVVPLAAVTVLGTSFNGGEVWLGARLHGTRVPPSAAFTISALSTAANLLPIPGAALVKVGALRRHGIATRDAVRATAGLGVVWVGLGVGLAAALQWSNRPGAAAAGAAGGLVLVALGLVGLGRATVRQRVLAVALEAGSVACACGRVALILVMIDQPVDAAGAAALAAAGIVASAAGLFPGGLGLRELLSGLTAGLVGLERSVGVVVAALDRLTTVAVLSVVTGGLALAGRIDLGPDEEPVAQEA